jgi:hypothetical protein
VDHERDVGTRPPPRERHPQRIHDQRGAHVRGELPADHDRTGLEDLPEAVSRRVASRLTRNARRLRSRAVKICSEAPAVVVARAYAT